MRRLLVVFAVLTISGCGSGSVSESQAETIGEMEHKATLIQLSSSMDGTSDLEDDEVVEAGVEDLVTALNDAPCATVDADRDDDTVRDAARNIVEGIEGAPDLSDARTEIQEALRDADTC